MFWDVHITYRKIGGAPLNLANRLQLMENDVAIISAIGEGEFK